VSEVGGFCCEPFTATSPVTNEFFQLSLDEAVSTNVEVAEAVTDELSTIEISFEFVDFPVELVLSRDSTNADATAIMQTRDTINVCERGWANAMEEL